MCIPKKNTPTKTSIHLARASRSDAKGWAFYIMVLQLQGCQ
ncbi:hypothetical protein C4K04_3036 [Pseudomonas chlororaphis]|uniref:Uncharacterized protein n=1 Tax=Pseudomonas chlororaphis TaxID=587753 RepID=A0A3G7TQC5_9PSED|nr:hypothetical protein C4K04_3036 [Pseudomonas chlororaphis]